MTEREVDDLLRELRDELAVVPSPAFPAAVRQRIARASRVHLRAAVAVAASVVVLVVAAMPPAYPFRSLLVVPDVPIASRAVPSAAAPIASVAFVPPATDPVAATTVDVRSDPSSSPHPDPQPAGFRTSVVAMTEPVFASNGVWVKAALPSWTASTYATVATAAPQWTTVPENRVFEPVEFPNVEFTRATVMPVTWPVIGEEHQR